MRWNILKTGLDGGSSVWIFSECSLYRAEWTAGNKLDKYFLEDDKNGKTNQSSIY